MKIFCAEAIWDKSIKNGRTSYIDLLNLIQTETNCQIEYFTFNTMEELDYLFKVFKKSKFDIFYLASHMGQGDVTSGLGQDVRREIYDILSTNKDCIKGKVLHLAGCSSLKEKYFDIKKAKELCDAKIISGYTIDTDTTESSAMDLLYLINLIRDGHR